MRCRLYTQEFGWMMTFGLTGSRSTEPWYILTTSQFNLVAFIRLYHLANAVALRESPIPVAVAEITTSHLATESARAAPHTSFACYTRATDFSHPYIPKHISAVHHYRSPDCTYGYHNLCLCAVAGPQGHSSKPESPKTCPALQSGRIIPTGKPTRTKEKEAS